MPNVFADFTATTLAGGASGIGTTLQATDTKMYLQAGFLAAHYPTVYPFPVLLGSSASSAVGEVVSATGSPGTDQLTIVRGVDGTNQAWPITTTPVQMSLTSGIMNALNGTYNVKMYGAVGNGVADDTAAIAAASAAANTAGGGRVYFPAGTYLTGTQTIYPSVHYVGDGINATIVQLKNSVNADLFQGQNALTWIGTNNSSVGITDWSIREMTLDGNKANQTGTSNGIRVYGYGFAIENVVVRKCLSDGIYSEWAVASEPPTVGDSVEANLNYVKVHDCSGNGIEWAGPHDSVAYGVICFNNGNTDGHSGFYIRYSTTVEGGLDLINCHAFGGSQSYALKTEAQITSQNCAWESASTSQVLYTGTDASHNSTNSMMVGDLIYGGGVASPVGITIGSASGPTVAPAGLVIKSVQILNCTSGSLVFANDGGLSSISLTGYQASGTVVSGSPAASTYLNYDQFGTGVSQTQIAGHAISNSNAVTLGALQSHVGSQSIVQGNDVAGTITYTTTAGTAPAAGGAVVIVNFGKTFPGGTPNIVVCAAGTSAVYFQGSGSGTGFTVFTVNALAVSTTYYFTYLVVG